MNQQHLSFEAKSREWLGSVESIIVYGLMGVAFFLFFVRLNHLVEYTIFGLLITWILAKLKNGTLQWRKTSLDIPILLYLGWVLFCVFFAVDPEYSFGEWRKAAAQFLIFFLVVQVVKTQYEVYSLVLSSAVGMVVLSCLEAMYFFAEGHFIWDMNYRAGGFSGSSQWFSTYLVMGLPILWFISEVTREHPIWFRVLMWAGLGITLLGLILAHTRGAWLAIGLQIFIYLLLKLKINWWVVFGGAATVLCLLLVIVSFPIIQETLSMSAYTHTGSMKNRFNTWAIALQDIAENPLIGIGIGKHSFGKVHPNFGDGFHNMLHNTFLARAVQTGIPGFLLFLFIFVVIVTRAAGSFQKFIGEWRGQFALMVSLIVVGVIVRNFFDDMFNGTIAYLFLLLTGLFFSMENMEKRLKT